MPWSVYNSNGKLLQSLAIGDDSVVEGKLDVSNAPTNGYFLQAQSAEGGGLTWAAVSSAVTREGGQSTEATTTSTSAADLLTASSLTIAVAEHFILSTNARKTSGAAENAGLGLKLNSTTVSEALATGANCLWGTDTENRAENGISIVHFAARLTNYEGGAVVTRAHHVTTVYSILAAIEAPINTAAIPLVTITAVVLRGISDSSSNTLGADELQVYSMAAS